jgi:hypothetical protein
MKSGGSSGGGAPKQQPKPQGPVTPYGQTSNPTPNYTNFLPSDPNAMATGLTPQMMAGIDNANPAPPPPLSGGMAPGGDSTPVNGDALRQLLAKQKAQAMIAAQPTSMGYNPTRNRFGVGGDNR